MGNFFKLAGATFTLGLLTAGCAEIQLGSHAAKRIANNISPPANATTQKVDPDGYRRTTGVYKVGSPYQVGGVWYHPKEQRNYDETGIASWYGPDFHGKATANGEAFDMNDVSAAHQTLPLPTMVRVTNLENGRSLLVRINDRGPFVNGRIIDLSRRSAQLLGFHDKGTAKVRVTVVQSESERFVAKKPTTTPEEETLVSAAPRESIVATELPPPNGVAEAAPTPSRTIDPALRVDPVKDTKIYVQAGAFTAADRANRVRDSLKGFGPATVIKANVQGQDFHRVRIGPLSTVSEADTLLTRIIGSGHGEARIVVD